MKALRSSLVTLCAALLFFNPSDAVWTGATEKSATKKNLAGQSSGSGFKPACAKPSYPSPPPSTALAIDKSCGASGSGTGAEAAQNQVKNNFCAKGTAKAMTIADFQNLQAQVEKNPAINFGDENNPPRMKGPTTDRAPLKRLGEGRLVTVKAYVLLARQEGGESVNCGKNVPNQPLFHDIHIELVASPDDSECTSIVAEMSPHRRPDSWTQANVEKVAKSKALVRVTGQLFFDSSHEPCADGKPVRSNPHRVSLWEIHPIYKFEVCTANCDKAGTWLTLDKWVAQQ